MSFQLTSNPEKIQFHSYLNRKQRKYTTKKRQPTLVFFALLIVVIYSSLRLLYRCNADKITSKRLIAQSGCEKN